MTPIKVITDNISGGGNSGAGRMRVQVSGGRHSAGRKSSKEDIVSAVLRRYVADMQSGKPRP
jgi:hypothetical protein